jgi:hypothetical protein
LLQRLINQRVTRNLGTQMSYRPKIEFLIEPENAAARYVKFKDVVYWVNVIMYEVDPNWKG